MKSHAALALACIALAIQKPLAQSSAPQALQTPALSARSTLVLVPALVRSRSGDLVFALAADDFVLTDDGIPQKLTLEQDTGGEPLALVVAIEAGGAGAREFDKLGGLAPMIESVVGNVPHKIAVVAFDSQPTMVREFTADSDAAVAAIRDVGPGDNGAAILDSLGFSVDLLRKQPSEYRRAILLVSETLDRGSHLKLEEALRAISDTNTAIYSIGFSTGRSEAAHYASRELPTQPSEPKGSWLSLENQHPNPPNGCMGKDPDPDPDATHNKVVQAYDCLTQLAPPLALAKTAAISASDGLRRNIPETVAHLTGGEYFRLTDAKSLERNLATISNHMPNRYVLSFQPQSPHPGLHAIGLHLRNYANLAVTARSSYWADVEDTPSDKPSITR
jgi:VWFA-related protein